MPAKKPMTSTTFTEKLQLRYYDVKLPYGAKGSPERAAYQAEHGRLAAEFKADLLDEEGVTGNPKADLCFRMAEERGHSSGYSEIASVFSDLVELIR